MQGSLGSRGLGTACIQIRAFPRGPARPYRRAATVSADAGRKFADFLVFEERGSEEETPPSDAIGSDKATQLVDRAGSLLIAAREALEQVRQRDPADSQLRLHGANITATTTEAASSGDGPSGAAPTSPRSAASAAALRGLTDFVWESDLDGQDDGSSSFVFGGSRDYAPPPAPAADAGGEWGGGGGGQSWSQSGLDSWFGDKVDVGPVALRQTMKPVQVAQVAVLERPAGPATLEFQAPEAPESAGPSLFPETMQLHFQPSEAEVAAAAEAETATAAEAEPEVAPPEGDWERRSGEETGPHGYWYRWTEVRGCDETGAVQWYEKWWEVSDWRGMKEMGAEKWGCNAQGDAWRETWREAIVVAGSANSQPLVERTAHKWAKSGEGYEWEEKWGEKYWSAGGAEKWADKWGREGGDIWHEKWGETYDGAGGCVKWTDKWAERNYPGGAKEEWGDKWEENFKAGRGTKQGETWSISGSGERYNRWWGENHFGDGLVQKFGNSNTGEHWDVTEQMDTYYNPIPHFGYNLALAHSPQLRNVPMLPRDRASLEGGMQAIV